MTSSESAITVNGEARSVTVPGLTDLLRAEGLDPNGRGFAVALNGAVLPRRVWPETDLAAGDRIEIVTMHKGG